MAALERKPAWLDHVPAIRDWNLPQSFERLRSAFKDQLGPRTGDRHYIRVLQLLMRHPTSPIDRAIGMLIHDSTELAEVKPAITAELIAQAADRLAAAIRLAFDEARDSLATAATPEQFNRFVDEFVGPMEVQPDGSVLQKRLPGSEIEESMRIPTMGKLVRVSKQMPPAGAEGNLQSNIAGGGFEPPTSGL